MNKPDYTVKIKYGGAHEHAVFAELRNNRSGQEVTIGAKTLRALMLKLAEWIDGSDWFDTSSSGTRSKGDRDLANGASRVSA